MPLALIANPAAGGQRCARLISRVRSALSRHSIDYRLFVSRYHGHAAVIAGKLSPQQYRGIVAIGGDGTNFHVLNGLLRNNPPSSLPPLGIIPVGSGNSFARDLGILNPSAGIRALVRGSTRPVDVCRFTQAGDAWYFINLAGFGWVTDVARTAHRWKRLGDFSYALGVFHRTLNLRFHYLEMEMDGKRMAMQNCFVECCNSRYTGGRMLMAPGARIDDGLMDIVVVGPLRRSSLLAAFPKIFRGTHGRHPAVRFFQARRLSVVTDPPQMLLPDGELFGSTPTEITIAPRLVRYFA